MIEPYQKYKDSRVEWVGKIPNQWIIKRGKFLFKNRKEKNTDFQCDNLLSLTLEGVLKKDMFSDEGLRPTNYETYQVFYPENLVFKLIDLENIKTSRVGYVLEKGIMSPVYIRLEAKQNNYSKYFYYQYYDLYKKNIFNFLGEGVRSTLSPSDLLEIPQVLPSLSEQKQIASFIDHKTQLIDELIEKTVKKIELLKEKRTSLINHCVTKGLNPNVEMKDSGVEWIGEIPNHWTIKKLKYLGDSIIGLTYKPDNIVNDESEGILVLRASNIKNGFISLNDTIYVNMKMKDSLITKEGDILICSRSGSRSLIGKNLTISKELVGNTFGVFMTIYRSNYWKFLSMVFNSPIFHNQSGLFMTSTINQLTIDTLKNFIIPFPIDYKERLDIYKYLIDQIQKIDSIIEKETQRIELLKEYRQSLISEVVTGKIDVRDEVK